MQFFRDMSPSALAAGLVAALVGFTSSAAIIFQAARAFGANDAMVSSWVWAIGWGAGLCTVVPSLWTRKPVMVAWSTPGAAVLALAGNGHSMGDAVGAFMVSAALIVLFGVTGWFEKAMARIPVGIAAALLAGVLAKFGMQAFAAAGTSVVLVATMLLVYLLARRWVPRYAVLASLAAGVGLVLIRGEIAPQASIPLVMTTPVWVPPAFSWATVVGMALPLFVVTMASQNLPGVVAIRAAGYRLPVSRIISLSGLATLVLAPFGAFALNLSAITAAICMGPESHLDPARRYVSAVVCGLLYCLLGLAGATVVALLAAFPAALVSCIAGLALLGTIGSGLATLVDDAEHREAAVITFVVTLSGVSIAGVGSAFWGVVAGTVALFVQKYRLHARA
ncbi:benzoate/H(+) symporter BenE family transporter [Xylophilus sp. GOD-11R]|uniref:benzoate/H(+) symporter BenE family transporter n=1 Tax=Xylophilus sp. GOD-11R TaxID=3089814 RepID=UPI00298C9288|nr:benzoate/H(+) symporter BenE family transporter [Xylophilus sp. GOD-11R]WPB57224.1 benzoate/H(+) symporter BenE family transporter [Xylophilus sp. GOD-11R]